MLGRRPALRPRRAAPLQSVPHQTSAALPESAAAYPPGRRLWHRPAAVRLLQNRERRLVPGAVPSLVREVLLEDRPHAIGLPVTRGMLGLPCRPLICLE